MHGVSRALACLKHQRIGRIPGFQYRGGHVHVGAVDAVPQIGKGAGAGCQRDIDIAAIAVGGERVVAVPGAEGKGEGAGARRGCFAGITVEYKGLASGNLGDFHGMAEACCQFRVADLHIDGRPA